MKRLFVLVIAFGLAGNLSAKKFEDTEANYHITLSLDMPKIEDIAVIEALVSFDPMASFKDDVLRQEKHKITDKEYAEREKKLNIPVDIVAGDSWNLSIFSQVKASDSYILEQKSVSKHHGHSLSGNVKNKTMWLVTKATVYGGKPLAWVIPLDIKEGFKADVVLNKKNAINLIDLYKQIVAEASKK